MSDFKTALESLLPDGALWRIDPEGDLDKLFDGLGDREQAVFNDLNQLARIRDPRNTPILDDLEREYGVIKNNSLTEAERRDVLHSIVYARSGSGTIDYLRQRLIDAGFDLQVHENSPAVDPNPFLIQPTTAQAGEPLAQAGEPGMQAQYFEGELVVNGDVYDYWIDYIAAANETLAQAGEPLAQAGSFSGTIRQLKEYTLPALTPASTFSETFRTTQSVIDNGGTIFGGTGINVTTGFWPMINATHDPGSSRTLDVSGNGYHALFAPAVPTKNPQRGYFLSLGSNKYFSISNGINPGTNSFTVLIQLQLNSVTGGFRTAFGVNWNTGAGVVDLRINNTGAVFYQVQVGGVGSINTAGILTTNVHSIAGVIDNSVLQNRVYIDGILSNTVSHSSGVSVMSPLSYNLGSINTNWVGIVQFYDGSIYSFRIEQRALSQQEIMDWHANAIEGLRAV